jgi:hypothetical protein
MGLELGFAARWMLARVRVAEVGGDQIQGSARRDTQAQGFRGVRRAEDAELRTSQVLRHVQLEDCALASCLASM